jgi:hypothetical protein
MHEDRMHVEIFSQLATLLNRVICLEHEPKVAINFNFFIGGSMDFTRVNAAAAKNTSIGGVLDEIFDAIAAAIRSNKSNQAELDKLADQLESDNVREDLRVSALKGLVTPEPAAFSATFNGPTTGTVGTPYTGAVIAAGGTAPYSFVGTGPAWLTFAADGSASGTPDAAGEVPVSGSATDAAGASAQWSGNISVS